MPTEKEKNAFISSAIILLLALVVEIVFFVVLQEKDVKTKGIIIVIVALLSPIAGLYVWNKYVPRYSPPVINFLVTNFLGRRLVGGGSFAYYEYKPPEEKETFLRPVFRLISVIIAYLGMTVTIAKMIFQLPFASFDPKSPLASWPALIVWIFLMLLVPILLTPVIPITWGLEDAKAKIWNSGKKTNWLVSDKYRMRFNSFITASAILAGAGLGDQGLVDNLLLFVKIIYVAFLMVILPNAVIVFSYYLLFHRTLLSITQEAAPLPVYETKLIQMETLETTPIMTGQELEIEAQSEETESPIEENAETENLAEEISEATLKNQSEHEAETSSETSSEENTETKNDEDNDA